MSIAAMESLENGPIDTQFVLPQPVEAAVEPDAFVPRTPSDELLAMLQRKCRELEAATPEDILQWVVQMYYPRFMMATSLGPEGCVLISMLAKIEPRVYVFNLDTGYQFQETYRLRDRIAEKYGIEVNLQKPELSVQGYESFHGGPVYRSNPDRCCFDRKVRVLRRVALGFDAWGTGIRRDQSPTRAGTPILRWDKRFGLIKVSPLANWTRDDVWKRIIEDDIPCNPLHEQGFPSIGCWPCTRAVLSGEDERAGRWSGTAKVECGLHVQ